MRTSMGINKNMIKCNVVVFTGLKNKYRRPDNQYDRNCSGI